MKIQLGICFFGEKKHPIANLCELNNEIKKELSYKEFRIKAAYRITNIYSSSYFFQESKPNYSCKDQVFDSIEACLLDNNPEPQSSVFSSSIFNKFLEYMFSRFKPQEIEFIIEDNLMSFFVSPELSKFHISALNYNEFCICLKSTLSQAPSLSAFPLEKPHSFFNRNSPILTTAIEPPGETVNCSGDQGCQIQ